MSTIVLPEQVETLFPGVHWSLYLEDGGKEHDSCTFLSYHSKDGTSWRDISTDTNIGEILLPLSYLPGYRLYLYPDERNPNQMIRIEPPEPVPMFHFCRYATPLSSLNPIPVLRYSCFGYILPDYLFVVKIFPPCPFAVTEQRLLKRPATFPL